MDRSELGNKHICSSCNTKFYDLKKDPAELNNLINLATYKGRIKKLKTELYQLKKEYSNQLSLKELRYITDNDFGGLESKRNKK